METKEAHVVSGHVVESASIEDVLRDQLELLIEHTRSGVCGCEQCVRFLNVKKWLTSPFSDSPRVRFG